MDGFKNSTRTHYMKGGACEGYAKGGSVKGAAKVAKVMGEFKSGSLHSGSKKGPEVTNPKQAVAIALSEARKAGAKIPVKKADGGMVTPLQAAQAKAAQSQAMAAQSRTAAQTAASAVAQRAQAAQQQKARLAQVRARDAQRKVAHQNAMATRDTRAAAARAETQRIADAANARAAASKAQPQVFTRTKQADGTFGAAVARKTGGRATMADLNKANRDVGGMSAAEVKAAGEAIARGNRMAVEEGKESRLVGRKATPRTREMTVENSRTYSRAEPAAPMSDLERRLTTLPSQRGEMRRGPAGAGFSVQPLVSAVRSALGFKKGGLSAMPRGKKC